MEQQRTNTNRFLNKTALMNGAGGVLDGGLEFYFRRQANPDENMAVSIGASAAVAAAWYFMPTVMWAKTGMDLVGGIGQGVAQYKKQYRDDYYKQANREGFGGNFQDTAMGATMRQRGVQAIANSKLNARSAFNGQARSLHQF